MFDSLNQIVNLRELLTRAVKYVFEGIMGGHWGCDRRVAAHDC